MNVRVSASLWSISRQNRHACALRLVDAGVPRFHWDLADGVAAPKGGFSVGEARRISDLTGAAAEAHLMVKDPRPQIAEWVSFCDTIAVQADQPHCREAIELIRDLGAQAVVAVRTGQQLQSVAPPTGVLVMAVAPGHAGSAFDERSHDLVVAALRAGHRLIGVDGSINPERLRRLRHAGANWFVSGTSLTNATHVADWYRRAGLATHGATTGTS